MKVSVKDLSKRRGNRFKLTLAPQLALGNQFFGRPVLRAYITYSEWNDAFLGRVGGLDYIHGIARAIFIASTLTVQTRASTAFRGASASVSTRAVQGIGRPRRGSSGAAASSRGPGRGRTPANGCSHRRRSQARR